MTNQPDTGDIYEAANKIIEVFVNSFKFKNDRKVAEANLIKMSNIINEVIADKLAGLLELQERYSPDDTEPMIPVSSVERLIKELS